MYKSARAQKVFSRRLGSPAPFEIMTWKQHLKVAATSKTSEFLKAWSWASLTTSLSFGIECCSNKKHFTCDWLAQFSYFKCIYFSCKKEGLGASLFTCSMFGSTHSTRWDAIPLNPWQSIFFHCPLETLVIRLRHYRHVNIVNRRVDIVERHIEGRRYFYGTVPVRYRRNAT